MNLFKFTILFFTILASTNAFSFNDGFGSFVDGGEFLSDSGIYGPSYEEQINSLIALEEQYPQMASVFYYGETLGKRPLAGVVFHNKAMETKKFTLITGATHGNEYLNIVDRLPAALLQVQNSQFINYLNSGGAVVFIPVLNPDGYEERRRHNNNGRDLNRDFPNHHISLDGLSQPETKALAFVIDDFAKDKSMELAMDYHCCVRGMLLIPYGYTNKYMPEQDQNRYSPIMTAMDQSFTNPGRKGTPPDLLYSARGTSLDYWYMKYGAISMTYEGRYREEKNMLGNHVLWWEQIFGILNQ